MSVKELKKGMKYQGAAILVLSLCVVQVILRVWKISSRNKGQSRPGEVRNSHPDFLADDKIQSTISACSLAHSL